MLKNNLSIRNCVSFAEGECEFREVNQPVMQFRARAENQGRLPPNPISTAPYDTVWNGDGRVQGGLELTTAPAPAGMDRTLTLFRVLKGLPYRVVQNHHAIQQRGQGIKSTSIET